jgi:RNA polymerase sigma-70 factor (ECF subfamily)
MVRLQGEWVARDREEVFLTLRTYLTQEEETISYRDAGVRAQMSEGAVKAAVHRLRKRYRELLFEEIAETVTSKAQVDEEINELFEAVGA